MNKSLLNEKPRFQHYPGVTFKDLLYYNHTTFEVQRLF